MFMKLKRRGVSKPFTGPGPERAYHSSSHILLSGPGPEGAYRSSSHILLSGPDPEWGVSKLKPYPGPGPEGAYRSH